MFKQWTLEISSHRETMDRGPVSDFSIERILSPQLGPRPPLQDFPPDGYQRRVTVNVRPSSPVQVLLQAMGCQHCRERSFGEERYLLYTPAVHQQHFYPNPGVYAQFSQNCADVQHLAAYSGYRQPAAVPPQSLQKLRMRTVFTDSQIKQLEALFEVTDYPAVDTRAELARRTGLSEETVRVWFKNRRARRKRQ